MSVSHPNRGAPIKMPARALAPMRPIHTDPSPSCGPSRASAIPIMPRMYPSIKSPPVVYAATLMWKPFNGASSMVMARVPSIVN